MFVLVDSGPPWGCNLIHASGMCTSMSSFASIVQRTVHIPRVVQLLVRFVVKPMSTSILLLLLVVVVTALVSGDLSLRTQHARHAYAGGCNAEHALLLRGACSGGLEDGMGELDPIEAI